MTEKTPPIDEKKARGLLKRERERIEGSLADLKRVRRSELDEVEQDSDPSDEGEQIEEEEVDEAVERQLRWELEAVERAEKRLEEGAYGFSVESGDSIPAKRLEAVPWAERTAEEQERFERTHGRQW
jgi:DnaK suppressor protein